MILDAILGAWFDQLQFLSEQKDPSCWIMEDIATLELQAQVRKLNKQMVHMKKVVKEPSYFDGISLDPTIYLRWVRTFEDYFKAKDVPIREFLDGYLKSPRLCPLLI